ncbi:MAG: hypothetical protein ACI4KM_03255 [Oscillospiraceae bacterium]
MNPFVPVELIFALASVFAGLAMAFLSGKGASLFVGHNTLHEPAFSGKKAVQSAGSVPLSCCGVSADYGVDLEQLPRMVYLRFLDGYRREYSGLRCYLQFESYCQKAVLIGL